MRGQRLHMQQQQQQQQQQPQRQQQQQQTAVQGVDDARPPLGGADVGGRASRHTQLHMQQQQRQLASVAAHTAAAAAAAAAHSYMRGLLYQSEGGEFEAATVTRKEGG